MAHTTTTPWVRHILNEAAPGEVQHCILCGATVASHFLGALPATEIFERNGRLHLIEPDADIYSCLQQPATQRSDDGPSNADLERQYRS